MAVTDDERREDLRRLYALAIEEYRFQLTLNNQRFQWFTTLDVAMLTVGTGLFRLSNKSDGHLLTALVFGVGSMIAVFTMFTYSRQVDYQHRARATARKIAAELGLTEFEIGSTPGWGRPAASDGPNWRPKVRQVNYGLLAVMAVVHGVGVYYTLTH